MNNIGLEEMVHKVLDEYSAGNEGSLDGAGYIRREKVIPILKVLVERGICWEDISSATGRSVCSVRNYYRGSIGKRIISRVPIGFVECLTRLSAASPKTPERIPVETAMLLVDCYLAYSGLTPKKLAEQISGELGMSADRIEKFFWGIEVQAFPFKFVDFLKKRLAEADINTLQEAKDFLEKEGPYRVPFEEVRFLYDINCLYGKHSSDELLSGMQETGYKFSTLYAYFELQFRKGRERSIRRGVKKYLLDALLEDADSQEKELFSKRLFRLKDFFLAYVKTQPNRMDAMQELGNHLPREAGLDCFIDDLEIFLLEPHKKELKYDPKNPRAYRIGEIAYLDPKNDFGRVIKIETSTFFNIATFELFGSGKQARFVSGKY